MLNFKGKTSTVNTDVDVNRATVLISNYTTASADRSLRPYEAVIYEL